MIQGQSMFRYEESTLLLRWICSVMTHRGMAYKLEELFRTKSNEYALLVDGEYGDITSQGILLEGERVDMEGNERLVTAHLLTEETLLGWFHFMAKHKSNDSCQSLLECFVTSQEILALYRRAASVFAIKNSNFSNSVGAPTH